MYTVLWIDWPYLYFSQLKLWQKSGIACCVHIKLQQSWSKFVWMLCCVEQGASSAQFVQQFRGLKFLFQIAAPCPPSTLVLEQATAQTVPNQPTLNRGMGHFEGHPKNFDDDCGLSLVDFLVLTLANMLNLKHVECTCLIIIVLIIVVVIIIITIINR